MKNFDLLVHSIHDTHTTLQQSVVKVIDKHATLRNWLIGFYIVEFEQNGEDKAKYGGKLLRKLADSLGQNSLSHRSLRLCRQFYLHYPQIARVIGSRLEGLGIRMSSVWQSPIAKLLCVDNEVPQIEDPLIVEAKNACINYQIDPERLIDNLSYAHLVQLFPIASPVKRAFYESECIRRNWSVSELKQQINTMLYERSGMRVNLQRPSLVSERTESGLSDMINSPYIFEFLGLKAKDVIYENDLRQGLIDNLERFLIDLDHGFCLEAKKKHIAIGEEHYYVDLVFYHRILKCHVLIALQMDAGRNVNDGRLESYLRYYKKEVMSPGDNPPVGLLLGADQHKALVEYVVADEDRPLFGTKYLDELPTKAQWEMCLSGGF